MMNIKELTENIAAGLLSDIRQDRICISFETYNTEIKISQDFLIGIACTYGAFHSHEITIKGDDDPVMNLLCWLKSKNQEDPYAIYYVNMGGSWTAAQLRDLWRRGDLFDNLQMIFWVREYDLKNYLRSCPELGWLFRKYKLTTLTLREVSDKEIYGAK